jgi:hypothetical protein
MMRASLVGLLFKLGRKNEANEQISITRPLMVKENEYNRACFEAICGNADEALGLLKRALEKKQVSLRWVRQDPDIDFIHDDPRFTELVGESSK